MNINIVRVFLLIGMVLPSILPAQQPFTLRSAIDTALLNNFEIRIARNNAEMARISNSYGMAGGLPYASVTAGDNLSTTNLTQKDSDGTESTLSNQEENSVNASISAEMTLFNGFKVIATKERLNRLENLGELELNQQIQGTIANVMVTYYDIIRQQNYLKIIQHSLDVSNKKLDIVNTRNKVGMADAIDLLQARSDVNSSEQLLSLQELTIEQSKADLLLLIGARKEFHFEVTDTIEVDATLDQDMIMNRLGQNPQMLIAEQQIFIDEQLVKEVSSLRFPSVKLNAGYDFYRSDLNKGGIMMNQLVGPTAGITLQVPVFNGFIYKTQQDVAKIRVKNSIIEKESIMNSMNTRAAKTYRSYSTALQQIESQRNNYEMTRQLVEVVIQKFNMGHATILDVKAAQTSYENAAYLLANLKYSAKVAEIELKQLTYSLTY